MRIEETLDNHGLCLVFGHHRERLLEIGRATYQDRVKVDTEVSSYRRSLAHEQRDEWVCGRVGSENGNAGEVRDELAKQLQPLTCHFRSRSRYARNVTPGASQAFDEAVLDRSTYRRHNDWYRSGGFLGSVCSGRKVRNNDIDIEQDKLSREL